MNGEGFAYFRWTQLQKWKYIVRECQELMKPRRWPIPSEWRKLQTKSAAERSG